MEPVDWGKAEASLEVDRSVKEVAWAAPGTAAGMAMLHTFCSKKLKNFDKHRNDPSIDGLSNLSPWFHFGEGINNYVYRQLSVTSRTCGTSTTGDYSPAPVLP